MPRRDQADEQGEHGRPEEGRRRHKPDLDRAEADRREISRQDDDREAVAESAQTSRGVEQIDVRAIGWHSNKLDSPVVIARLDRSRAWPTSALNCRNRKHPISMQSR